MSLIKPTPWDTAVFGMSTWELTQYSESAQQQAMQPACHYTVKVESLADKRLLHVYGLYYCDVLIETDCDITELHTMQHSEATISKELDIEKIQAICNSPFFHDRFYCDFNLSKDSADLRYDNWMKQLIEARQLYGLYRLGMQAGFIGHSVNDLVLHALAEKNRSTWWTKLCWIVLCHELIRNGQDKAKSSISVTNLAVFKLYASLGFSFINSRNIYHRLVV